MNDRTRILNSRLDVIEKLLDNLTTQLANNSAHHLEWIVIWLIVVEVVLDFLRGDYLGNVMRFLGWDTGYGGGD